MKCLQDPKQAWSDGGADLDASPSSKYGLQPARSKFNTRCDHELQQHVWHVRSNDVCVLVRCLDLPDVSKLQAECRLEDATSWSAALTSPRPLR